MKTTDERLARCWRHLMGAWARRWRVVRHEHKEREVATLCLVQAIRCREKAKTVQAGGRKI